MTESERWDIDVSVEPSCNEDEYIIAVSLDGPGNCAFHTIILSEQEARELGAGLRRAFNEIEEARRAPHTVNGRSNGSARICATCLGSGRIADDKDALPWQYWEGLPEESRLAVTLGLVKPMACPACSNKGGDR